MEAGALARRAAPIDEARQPLLPAGGNRGLHSRTRGDPTGPPVNARSPRGRSLGAYLSLANRVDIVDVVAEIGRPVAVRPAGEVDPDHGDRFREPYVELRAFLDLGLQRGLVPNSL